MQLLGTVESGRFVAVTGFGLHADPATVRSRLDAEWDA